MAVRDLVHASIVWARRAGASGPQAPVVVLIASVGGLAFTLNELARDYSAEEFPWVGGFATAGAVTECYLIRWYRLGARREDQ